MSTKTGFCKLTPTSLSTPVRFYGKIFSKQRNLCTTAEWEGQRLAEEKRDACYVMYKLLYRSVMSGSWWVNVWAKKRNNNKQIQVPSVNVADKRTVWHLCCEWERDLFIDVRIAETSLSKPISNSLTRKTKITVRTAKHGFASWHILARFSTTL